MTPIDVNASLGRWPTRDFSIRTAAALMKKLKGEGISSAWVSSIDAVLASDPDPFDERLAKQLAGCRGLRPVKTVNPILGGAVEQLDGRLRKRRAVAIRLLPNYHSYRLDDARVAAAVRLAQRRKLPVLIQMRIEDERAHHPRMQVPAAPVADVVRLAGAFRTVKFVALCAYLPEARTLTTLTGNVRVDLSFMETMDTVASALADIPARRIIFGSHTPFLETRANVAKLASAEISASARKAIASGNARSLQRRTGR